MVSWILDRMAEVQYTIAHIISKRNDRRALGDRLLPVRVLTVVSCAGEPGGTQPV